MVSLSIRFYQLNLFLAYFNCVVENLESGLISSISDLFLILAVLPAEILDDGSFSIYKYVDLFARSERGRRSKISLFNFLADPQMLLRRGS